MSTIASQAWSIQYTDLDTNLPKDMGKQFITTINIEKIRKWETQSAFHYHQVNGVQHFEGLVRWESLDEIKRRSILARFLKETEILQVPDCSLNRKRPHPRYKSSARNVFLVLFTQDLNCIILSYSAPGYSSIKINVYIKFVFKSIYKNPHLLYPACRKLYTCTMTQNYI